MVITYINSGRVALKVDCRFYNDRVATADAPSSLIATQEAKMILITVALKAIENAAQFLRTAADAPAFLTAASYFGVLDSSRRCSSILDSGGIFENRSWDCPPCLNITANALASAGDRCCFGMLDRGHR